MIETAEGAFRRHYAQIYRYVRRRTASDAQAEDVTQEVFADAAHRLVSFVPGSTPVLAWLYTVAQRRLVDEARRRARRPEDAPPQLLELVPTPASEYGPGVARTIGAAIAELPRSSGESWS